MTHTAFHLRERVEQISKTFRRRGLQKVCLTGVAVDRESNGDVVDDYECSSREYQPLSVPPLDANRLVAGFDVSQAAKRFGGELAPTLPSP